MNITNHKKDNSYTCIGDSSIMRGTITMTAKEYAKAIMYLQNEYSKAQKDCNTAIRDGLLRAMATHRDSYMQYMKVFSLGVTATQLLFKKYKLPNYKEQNYAIKIK